MDFDIERLREIEAACIAKFSAKARALREADPSLNAGIARAKACAAMPQVTEEYLWATQRLTFSGLRPKVWS
jgi:hypothetical protein